MSLGGLKGSLRTPGLLGDSLGCTWEVGGVLGHMDVFPYLCGCTRQGWGCPSSLF